uniref:C-type lectin domain containing 16A n=1 Tax=Tetraodon nigroviridis TaxID=99883 RepID=H3D223_TETNG
NFTPSKTTTMFGRSRSWVGGQGRTKNIHSLDHLKYMYHVLTKNTTVTDHNRNLLVETIRSITEILIWGDQNDSSVFDFFLEKNMFAFFLNILRQKSGRYVCVQLLQTLNILFENISHETSLYYLLSNNHVNSIIVHKFDFSDEEIMAYYISFLKTLSLKLNNHTVHFFYNEHTNDFALYTEAIKFFNHPESMVRIAVRTITLNVYKALLLTVDNQHMLHYIRDKTAVPYFSNLVWFIGSHVIELDKCVQTDEEHKNRGKLSDLVAEHLDHLHYLNDILIINCEFLNDVLTDHLLNRLFLPLYVYSLVSPETFEERNINPQVSLYLLSQVFLIIHYQPLVNALADVILNGDLSVCTSQTDEHSTYKNTVPDILCACRVDTTVSTALTVHFHGDTPSILRSSPLTPAYARLNISWGQDAGISLSLYMMRKIEMVVMEKCKATELTEQNITDEEKSAAATRTHTQRYRPFLDMVYSALDCTNDDYHALFVLCLLYAVSHSKGVNKDLLERLQLPVPDQERNSYSLVLVERLIRVMSQAAQPGNTDTCSLLSLYPFCTYNEYIVITMSDIFQEATGLCSLQGAREESLHLLRRFYKVTGVFFFFFQVSYRCFTSKPLNVEYLMMDASVLLPPTGTPLTGIDFVKRLPCGDVEKTRRAIRVFFMLRSLSLQLQGEPETQLPLTRTEDLIKTDDVLDLNNMSKLFDSVVFFKSEGNQKLELAVDVYQMSLVEPETKRLGWGVVKFAGLLQDMQVSGVEDDSRALNIIIHKPSSNPHAKPLPILQANFIFADHIRCIIAKQRLAKGRIQARHMKMQRITALLDLPVQPSATEVLGFSQTANASPSALPFRFYEQSRRAPNDPTASRSVFASVDRVPGFAVAHCVSQHSPSPLSSPSPPSSGSGSTGRCDSVTASTISAQSPAAIGTTPPQERIDRQAFPNEGAFLDHTPPSSSSAAEGEGAAALAPSLTPASQPTISLLPESSSDSLSVESLTLLPPADSPHLYPCARLSSVSQNLPRELVTPTEEEPEGQGNTAAKEETED